MKINEILQENAVGTLQPDVADALPNTTVLTDFKNTDPYEQYRMGLAIAGPQGGGTLNGTAMKAEAQAQMDAKVLELVNYVDGSQPITFVIG